MFAESTWASVKVCTFSVECRSRRPVHVEIPCNRMASKHFAFLSHCSPDSAPGYVSCWSFPSRGLAECDGHGHLLRFVWCLGSLKCFSAHKYYGSPFCCAHLHFPFVQDNLAHRMYASFVFSSFCIIFQWIFDKGMSRTLFSQRKCCMKLCLLKRYDFTAGLSYIAHF